MLYGYLQYQFQSLYVVNGKLNKKSVKTENKEHIKYLIQLKDNHFSLRLSLC